MCYTDAAGEARATKLAAACYRWRPRECRLREFEIEEQVRDCLYQYLCTV
jgi:hypothetical protein